MERPRSSSQPVSSGARLRSVTRSVSSLVGSLIQSSRQTMLVHSVYYFMHSNDAKPGRMKMARIFFLSLISVEIF